MSENRTFRIVFVRPGHGTGETVTVSPDKVVESHGVAMTVAGGE